jgi:hypothetical protein
MESSTPFSPSGIHVNPNLAAMNQQYGYYRLIGIAGASLIGGLRIFFPLIWQSWLASSLMAEITVSNKRRRGAKS